MSDSGFLSLPDDDALKRLNKLAGKSLAAIVKHMTGIGLAGDFFAIVHEYCSEYVQARRKIRANEFGRLLQSSGPATQGILESAESSEPLLDVFLSILKECLNDDEDAKVRYYAALMIGFASPEGDKIPQHQKIALLNAMKSVRVHELYVVEVLASTRDVSHSTDVTLEELKKHAHHPAVGMIDWDLVLVSLRTLQTLGLVDDDPRQQAATVPQPNRYKLSKLGSKLWKLMGANLVESKKI